MRSFSGILPAVVTPFHGDGSFDEAAFERLCARLYAAGVDGLYVCGQTGEGLQQSLEQRMKVAEAAVRHSPPGAQVIVHCGAAATADAIRLARHAARAGAGAVSSLPPAGGYSFPEILGYYRDLAAACELPLLVYYFPSLAPALRTPQQILEICALPNVIGLKFTDSDFYLLSILKRHGLTVFNGSDEMLAAGLIMGADGGIGSTYNCIPDVYAGMWRAARAGEWERVRETQARVNEFVEVLLRYPVNSAVKETLRLMGLDCGECLPPRRPLTPVEKTELRGALASLALTAPRLAGGASA